jgi:putative addiction module component (TIGR02574 family)
LALGHRICRLGNPGSGAVLESLQGDPVSAKSLGIDKLDVDDRLVLAEEIWASTVADAKAFPFTPAQREELDRRIADDDQSPDDVLPWSDVKASVRARLGR